MDQKQKAIGISARVLSLALGLISILGGVAAFRRAGEPERYFVAAIVLIIGGLLWLGYAIFPVYLGPQKKSILIGIVLFLGLVAGLLYAFKFCGGECGCFEYRGYPGYWLKGSTCVTSQAIPIKMSHWEIDSQGLIADIVFWLDMGLMFSYASKFANSKPSLLQNQ